MANAPLWDRTARVLEVIWGVRELKYFRKNRKKDSTDKNHPASLICPSGKSIESLQQIKLSEEAG
jgi:hypothetical protein